MVNCAIIGCNSKHRRGNHGVRLFKVPSAITNQCEKTKTLSAERRRLWIKRINRKDITFGSAKRYTSVCSLHFISGAPSKLFENTSPDWAPCLHLGYESKDAKKMESVGKERYLRITGRDMKKNKADKIVMEIKEVENNLQDISSSNSMDNNLQDISSNNRRDNSSMTDVTSADVLKLYKKINYLQIEVQNLQKKNSKLMDDNIALDGKVTKVKVEVDSEITVLKNELKNYKKKNSQLTSENTALTTELENCKLQISQLISDNIAFITYSQSEIVF